jgi:hypothetical protein
VDQRNIAEHSAQHQKGLHRSGGDRDAVPVHRRLLIGLAYLLDRSVQWSAELKPAVTFAASAAALLLVAARVDINQFSLNAFYRNRLVRCYLGATRFTCGERQPQNFTGFDGDDDMALANSGADERRLPGPLHIVNCALNLGGSSDLALHTRHSAAFTLSPLHCGSAYKSVDTTGRANELGYIPTSAYGGALGAPTLGQAIAVSGAAASPNMGYHTAPLTAFLLTLFNLRLGWWFPNPGQSWTSSASPPFNGSCLFAELFGGADDKSRFLMISDGGHFENLAAYELIRRRCRVVIISDAECDPQLSFQGLGTLTRMCEVDFGTRIKLDLEALRRSICSDTKWPAAIGLDQRASPSHRWAQYDRQRFHSGG